MVVRMKAITAGEIRNLPDAAVTVDGEYIHEFTVTGSPTSVVPSHGGVGDRGGGTYRFSYIPATRGRTDVTVTATWSGGRTASRLIRVARPVVELNFIDTFNAAELAAFRRAEARWANIFTSALPAVTTAFEASYTGVRVNVSKDATLSGTGALATGAPLGSRSGNIVAEGNVKLNPDILTGGASIPVNPKTPYTNAQLQDALWHDLIMHEVFHVLAFTRGPMLAKALAEDGYCPTSFLGQYIGAGGVAAYNGVYRQAATKVPMECTVAHWAAGINFYPAMWTASLAVLSEWGYPIDLTAPLWQRWEEMF